MAEAFLEDLSLLQRINNLPLEVLAHIGQYLTVYEIEDLSIYIPDLEESVKIYALRTQEFLNYIIDSVAICYLYPDTPPICDHNYSYLEEIIYKFPIGSFPLPISIYLCKFHDNLFLTPEFFRQLPITDLVYLSRRFDIIYNGLMEPPRVMVIHNNNIPREFKYRILEITLRQCRGEEEKVAYFRAQANP